MTVEEILRKISELEDEAKLLKEKINNHRGGSNASDLMRFRKVWADRNELVKHLEDSGYTGQKPA